uniref:Uncharacterized protein n=1 Tax=Oryza punctata TaxID=4537 RepID=A0A0E0KVA6_ORYPU
MASSSSDPDKLMSKADKLQLSDISTCFTDLAAAACTSRWLPHGSKEDHFWHVYDLAEGSRDSKKRPDK